MERSEAIKVLSDCTIYHGGKATREALDLAIEALEKQIPKKPIAFWDGNENLIKCPVCKCPIDISEAEWSRQFCGKCGQAIDWSEDGEKQC